jgi:N-acetyl-gamma-glutamyl-phosphate reductase
VVEMTKNKTNVEKAEQELAADGSIKKKVAIIGASGFSGITLYEILKKHKKVDIIALNSESHAGKKVGEIHPKHCFEKDKFTSFTSEEIAAKKPNLVFLCLPEKVSLEWIKKLRQISKKIKIIDLSYALRFDKNAVYGLPEMYSDKIIPAEIVANPGCYSTAGILTLLPFLNSKYEKKILHTVLDCKSGVSGAGYKNIDSNNFNNLSENILPYNIASHKHQPEIQQFFPWPVSFTPHIIAAKRGIEVTAHIIFKEKVDPEEIKEIYSGFYQKNIFVKIVDSIPDLKMVSETNYCVMGGFEVDSNNRLVIVTVIDNLMKGAAGQAVQNMNLMFGFDTGEGLNKYI